MLTGKKEKAAGKKKSRKFFFSAFKQKVTEIKSHENSKIKMLQECKVANCWKGEKIPSKNALN